jgi:hypothetical protein
MMNDDDKKQYFEEFKNSEGSGKLDMWDYALEQQVIWEQIIAEMQKIALDQGVDKQLEKMMDEDMKSFKL